MIAAGVIVAVGGTVLALGGLGMTGHMAGHMLAVAVAAPLFAMGLAGTHYEPARLWPRVVTPLAMGTVELVLVWSWHLPAARALADHHVAVALIEQAMFLIAGIALWSAALRHRASGVGALLLTSMHMTLLGALIGLAPRPLYPMMAMHPAPGLDALADQQLGGVVMLLIGGIAYMAGGLALLGTMLRERTA